MKELEALNGKEMRQICGGRLPDADKERARERRGRERREREKKWFDSRTTKQLRELMDIYACMQWGPKMAPKQCKRARAIIAASHYVNYRGNRER